MKEYKAVQIQNLIGVSKIQLQHWVNSGCIHPYADDPRRGGVRYFDQTNLLEVLLCKALMQFRLPVSTMKLTLDLVRAGKGWEKAGEASSYFIVLVAISGLEGPGSTQGSTRLVGAIPLPDELKIFSYVPFFCQGDEVQGILADCPSAFVVNLAKILEEGGRL